MWKWTRLNSSFSYWRVELYILKNLAKCLVPLEKYTPLIRLFISPQAISFESCWNSLVVRCKATIYVIRDAYSPLFCLIFCYCPCLFFVLRSRGVELQNQNDVFLRRQSYFFLQKCSAIWGTKKEPDTNDRLSNAWLENISVNKSFWLRSHIQVLSNNQWRWLFSQLSDYSLLP